MISAKKTNPASYIPNSLHETIINFFKPEISREAFMRKFLLSALIMSVLSMHLFAAKITYLKGNAQLYRAQGNNWVGAKKGEQLISKDKIKCGKGTRAELKLDNGHKIKIWANSEISLDKLEKSQTGITLIAGKIRSFVNKLRKNENFLVKTPIAVCSVRGTDFVTEVGQNNVVRVEVYEGSVAAQETKTGQEVLVGPGQFTSISENQPPEQPQQLDSAADQVTSQELLAQQQKEESRKEMFDEISKDEVLARSAEEIKLAEYQNGKVLMDVFGKRVRLEEYILRTLPNEFKYVVLNTREDRFDFGKMIFTFNAELPKDLSLATKNMFVQEGAAEPTLWLTDVLTVMSNTQDQVNEEATGGRMFADNASNPTKWTLGFANYTFYVNNGKWWQYTDANANGAMDSGEISYFDTLGNTIDFNNSFTYDADKNAYYFTVDGQNIYFNEFTMPDGSTAFHFEQKNNYSVTQWITAGDYIITDDGKLVELSSLQNLTSSELEQKAYESNFERVYTSSLFGGRKIDLVFSAKLLMDAGILNLPDPSSAQ